MKQLNSKSLLSYTREEMNIWQKDFLETGIVVISNFIEPQDLQQINQESQSLFPQAYESSTGYNLFVDNPGEINRARSRLSKIQFDTKKSCICYDQISQDSPLKRLYNNSDFQDLICDIIEIPQLYSYADNLSSININYYNPGDSLEWHFDNCEFTVTLLIQKPKKGGMYQYFPNQRYKPDGGEDYESIEQMITGERKPEEVDLGEGDLVLFRGTESLHRVTQITEGQRILVTFCYNTQPGIALSETSRMTFFGRKK